ncbi:hypothetical protein F5Y05DRAFT_415820 [Hypoxylon sp. FL0543]|nr:hypothetical protein F5Y05DRAFT_415820 [Hypoxylon sp. FL0543]
MQVTRAWFILGHVVASVVSAAATFHQNHTASNSTPPSIGDGTPVKDFRLECDSNSMGLVDSQTRPGTYYLRGICGGLYDKFGASRCSFLDLGMCYVNSGGNMVAQKLGGLFGSCFDCVLYTAEGSSYVFACTCARREDQGGGTQEAAVHLQDLIYVKNGFLSCFGYTNFECPQLDVPY